MIKGGTGGGNTKTGLFFEGKTDLATFLNSQKGYAVKEGTVYFKNKLVGRIFKKYELYKFLEELKNVKLADVKNAAKKYMTVRNPMLLIVR